jgi:hypothetical protein
VNHGQTKLVVVPTDEDNTQNDGQPLIISMWFHSPFKTAMQEGREKPFRIEDIQTWQQDRPQSHEYPHHQADDTTIYTLGQIGQHSIVVACLPDGQTGTTSAAAVAMQIKSAFPSIRSS